MKDRLLAAARGPHALRGLAVVSFIESSVFPIPPDVMLIPMVLADRKRAWLIAGVCTVASVLGGVAGYAIGLFAFESVGRPILETLGKMDSYAEFQAFFERWDFLAVFGAGLTPFPYKVITISSGAFHINFAAFMAASVLSRGLRFFAEAGLLYLVGERARGFIERRFGLILTGFFALLIASFVALRLLH